MSDNTRHGSPMATSRGESYKKKPLDPRLFSGAKGTADDVRVQVGYPIWTLVAQWQAANYNDDLLLAGYPDLPREEWEAAKRYYRTHKPFIDARIIINSQPSADDDVPPMQTADEYFAYLASQEETNTSVADTQTTETRETTR